MSCDRCGPNREKGYAFCPDCGSPLQEGCIYCAQYEKEGYEFCGKCGRKLEPHAAANPAAGMPASSLKMAVLGVMPFIIVLILAELVSMFYGAGPTFTWLGDQSKDILMLLPALAKVGTLSGAALQAVWVAILVIIPACMAAIMYQSRAMFKPRSDGDTSEAEKTPLYWICLTFGATIVLEIAVTSLLYLLTGTSMEIPGWFDDMAREDLYFSMANAAVWEEVIARMLPMGVPFMILAICHGRKDFGRYLLGGFGMSRLALVLLIISSVMFGAAHISGWNLIKAVPATIGGFLMGYLFIRFGIHVSIAVHFMTDMTLSFFIYGDLGLMLFGGLTLIISVSGVVCLAILFGKVRKGLKDVRSLPVTGLEP